MNERCRDCRAEASMDAIKAPFSGWAWVTKFGGTVLYTCPECEDEADRKDDESN